MEILSYKGQLKCIIGKFEQGGGDLEQTGKLRWEAKSLINKDCHTSFSNISDWGWGAHVFPAAQVLLVLTLAADYNKVMEGTAAKPCHKSRLWML